MRAAALRFLLTGLLLSTAGCASAPDGGDAELRGQVKTHPLLEDVDRPQVNFPVELEPVPPAEFEPALPRGNASALLMVIDDEPFRGSIEARGKFDMRDGRIALATDRGNLVILYRIPPGMERGPPSLDEGTVTVRELSAPEAADQFLGVTDADGLVVLGQVWTSSPDPLKVAFGDDLVIAQDRVEAAQPGYTEVATLVSTGETTTEAVAGKPFRVKAEGAEFEVLLETSHFFAAPEDDSDQFPDAYILHAWIVRAG